MTPRKLKPIRALDRLANDERHKLWTDLDHGLSYSAAVRLLGAEHFISIPRHKLYAWWHREKDRRNLNVHLSEAQQLDMTAYLDLLNGQSLPWAALLHHHIYKAAFAVICSEEHTPAQLLTLQRIANNQFNQRITTEKIQLSNRVLDLRERQQAA